MGAFADNMLARMRARKNAKRIKHPAGVGVVMWCSQCRAELLRAPKGKAPTMKAQRAAYEAHRAVCSMRHSLPTVNAVDLERMAADRMHRSRWARRRAWLRQRWLWAALALTVGALVVVLLLGLL